MDVEQERHDAVRCDLSLKLPAAQQHVEWESRGIEREEIEKRSTFVIHLKFYQFPGVKNWKFNSNEEEMLKDSSFWLRYGSFDNILIEEIDKELTLEVTM